MTTRNAVLGYRLAINHLTGSPLPLSELPVAARAGLQDGSPRSALLSLAARVAGVTPDSWQDSRLVQVFGPRGAVYVVPRRHAGVFTKGLLPRDPARLDALHRLADRVHQVLQGQPMRQADLVGHLPDVGGTREIRWAACLGTLHAVWDTVDTTIVPSPPPSLDAEPARLELARRFFRHFAPASVRDLRWWLDGSQADAAATVAALHEELITVDAGANPGLVLAASADLLDQAAPPPPGVLLLPPDDVYISRLMQPVLVPDPERQRLLWPKAPAPGALIIDGQAAGTWRRRRRTRLRIAPWQTLTPQQREAAAETAARWPLSGPQPEIEWLEPQ